MEARKPVFGKSNSVEDMQHVRLMALLQELEREHGRKGAAAVLGQPLGQRRPALAPVFSRLLELDDAAPDQPIGGGHGGVDRAGGGLPGRVDDLRHVSADGQVGCVMAERCAPQRRLTAVR